jgi:hypothetical protein
MNRISRKALIPLATALAAGAVAIGSGATFTSQTDSATSFTTGTLSQSNDHAVVFNAAAMKPGDTYNGTVTIKNTGSLAQNFNLTESKQANPFGAYLQLTISENGTTLWTGDFDKLPAAGVALSPTTGWAKDEAHTYKFAVALSADTPNGVQGGTNYQGAAASATFTWNGTQTAGQTYN